MTMAIRINEWAKCDRPCERLLAEGPAGLTNHELMAILVGSGIRGANAVDVATGLLGRFGGNLKSMGKATARELMAVPGIGPNTACRIMAAVEIGKRRMAEKAGEQRVMGCATDIYKYMHPHMMDLHVEEAWVLLMNQKLSLLKAYRISQGGLTETAVDVRVIIKEALLCNATSIALVHNHPSGNTNPSMEDEKLTQRVKKACETMRIYFLDHVIVCDGGFYSFRELGRI